MSKKAIEHGVRTPKNTSGGSGGPNTPAINRSGIQTPSSSFDRRPEVGSASYFQNPQAGHRAGKPGSGVKQSKKHKSTGRGQ